MKKIFIVMMAFLLVSCQSDGKAVFEYDTISSNIEITTEDGTIIEDDIEMISSLYSVLKDAELTETTLYAPKQYYINLGQKTNNILLDSNHLRIDDTYYSMDSTTVQAVELLLRDYIKIEHVEIKEVDVEQADIPVVDLNAYTFAGKLSDGRELYYIPTDDYFTQKRASEIIIMKQNQVKFTHKGMLSIPVISPDGSKVSFVDGVGFELSGQLYLFDEDLLEVTSRELAEKQIENRTVKDSEWLSDEQLLIILGYDSGTVTQGGDAYSINLDDGDLRMVLDSKEGKEITDVLFDDGLLTYEVVTWIDKTYRHFEYETVEVLYEDIKSKLPVRVEFKPHHLDEPVLSASEITSLDLFNDKILKSDMTVDNSSKDNFPTYVEGSITYKFTEYANTIWSIKVTGETDFALPRNIEVGQTFTEVVNKFPNEQNYINADQGLIYGEISTDIELQGAAAYIVASNGQQVFTLYTANHTPMMIVTFKDGLVNELEVYFYIAN